MAKCKYQTLASKMEELLQRMDQFIEKTGKASQIAQFHFHEKIPLIDAPLIAKSRFEEQVKTHAAGMRLLSPSQELRTACCNGPFFGFYEPLLSQCLKNKKKKKDKKEILNRPLATWWTVKTILPRKMEPIIEQGYWETLLYCEDSTEYSYEIDWFEKESYTNTLIFQMESMFAAIERGNFGNVIIRNNLDQLALPYFRSLVEEKM